MEDVTDTVFRQIIARVGKPDIFFTEFTNVDGMFSEGREKVLHRLKFSKIERPIIAQIWGSQPENYYRAARYIKEKGFDGIDINMGCPQKDIIKKGLCAALIEHHELAARIIGATKDGAGGLPVSVKTRIGIKKISTEVWISFLLTQGLDALIIHGRTVKEMSDVPAHWDEIGKAVELRTEYQSKFGFDKVPVLIGNGDVKNRADGLKKIQEYGVDGVMIGRGIFENPRVFASTQLTQQLSSLRLYLAHVQLHHSTWGDTKHFDRLKKYAKMYVKNFSGSSELRATLVASKSIQELSMILRHNLIKYKVK